MTNTLDTERLATGLDADVLADARDRFYPDWWMFDSLDGSESDPRPAYRVVCRNDAELDLAYRAKPSFIDAQIVLEER